MNKNVADIEFVISEIGRISTLHKADKTKIPTNDYFASLPHPSGHGEMLCGTAALGHIRAAAERVITSSGYSNRLEVDQVYRALKTEIVDRFFIKHRDLNGKEADKAVSAALKKATRIIATLTHFIPCHLGGITDPSEFTIGPAKFRKRADIIKAVEDKLVKYLDEAPGPDYRDSAESYRELKEALLRDTRAHYESFGWITEITVNACDPNTSRKHAAKISQGALDCLHLLLGREYSHHMRSGGPNFAIDRRGHIEVDEKGDAEIWTSADWKSHFIGKEWWEKLTHDHDSEIVALLGVALTAGNAVPKPPPLARRFMDALAWYGEAVRDEFIASRIVKYVTAVERILTTEKAKDLTETIATRGSALTFAPDIEKLDDLADRFRAIYDLRSKLVHGSLSPLSASLWKGDRESEELARAILFRTLQFFNKEGLAAPVYSNKRLSKDFEKVLVWAQAAAENTAPAN